MFESSLELWANFGWNDLLNWRKEKYRFLHLAICVSWQVFPKSILFDQDRRGYWEKEYLVLLNPQCEREAHR